MASLIRGKEEIIKIAEDIARGMGIAKKDISTSDKCYEIYILAVREYDNREKEEERRRNEV